MTSRPHRLVLYLAAALVLSSILVVILNWVRSLVTVALIVFTILTLSRCGQKEINLKLLQQTLGLDC